MNDNLPAWQASLAAGLADLRVVDAMLDQKSLRCNIEAVEEVKFDFEAVDNAKRDKPTCQPGSRAGNSLTG